MMFGPADEQERVTIRMAMRGRPSGRHLSAARAASVQTITRPGERRCFRPRGIESE